MNNNWEIKKLGDVCDLYQPKTISSKDMIDGGQYPVFGANGIIGKYNKYNHEEPQLLITCRGATCGSVNVSEPKSWINGNAMVVKPKENSLNLNFIKYLFLGGIDISKTITGAAQPQITRQKLSPILITYPKFLPEQQRIVTVLDQVFASIAQAKANAEQNLKNAKALFDISLDCIFESSDELWVTKRLEELLKEQPKNGWSPPAKNHSEIGIPVLTLSAVTGFDFKSSCVKYTNANVLTDALYWVNNGDLLITRSNTPELVGHVAICKELTIRTIYPDLMMKINPKKNILLSQFLYYQLRSKKMRCEIMNAAHGANPTMKKINKQDVQNLRIKYPSLIVQQAIVEKLDAISAETKKLEAIYQQKLLNLEELKKSVLQKAFAGQL